MKSYLNTNVNSISAEKVKPTQKKIYKVVSLFSGGGGMDLGFEGGFEFLGKEFHENPFEVIFANDIFQQAADVYEANLPFNHSISSKIAVERRSINDLSMDKDFPKDKVDVVLGGFPCQSFSVAGKRGGLSDPRGQLYLQMIRVIKHYKPAMFVAENVDGIRNSRKDKNGEEVDKSALDTILTDFDDAGYNVQYHVLTAADYGVPQVRRRVIIIGIRKDLGDNNDVYYPRAEYDRTGEATGKKWVSAKEGIDDLWDKVNKGIPDHYSQDISKAKFYPGRKMQGNNRIAADRPAPTIRAEHHGNIEAHYRTTKSDPNDMSGWRRLSVRECARLQSFPDNFTFACSPSSAYKVVGNAVPPVMAWYIAQGVLYTLSSVVKKEKGQQLALRV